MFEKTGLHFEPLRFKFHDARQLAGTWSTHHTHLFSVKLTELELGWYKKRADLQKPLGNQNYSERTYIEVKTMKELLQENLADWSTLGMIFQILAEEN